LAADLLSDHYREALAQLVGASLDGALMEASIWRWDADAHLGPHRDLAEKIVTQVFYLSSNWDPEWGGCLRILRSSDAEDVAAELPPTNGMASVLVRSESSWHAVSEVRGAAAEPRRSVIVTWFRPGSTSPVWKLRDDGRVECVAAGQVGEPHRSPSALATAAHAHAVSSRRASSRVRPAPAAPSTLASPPRTRVAMVGTFDVGNFGDLLLPLIARHELSSRLGAEFEPTLYSYRPMGAESWPYEVRDLALLPHEIEHFDLLLIGGGQIVRFDQAFPPGYLPSDAGVHHPLGLWLTPALLASAVGVPVAWNAPGAADNIPRWLDPLVEVAVRAAAYVAVRDEISASILAEHASVPVHVVPDTGFGVTRLLPDAPSEEFTKLARDLGLDAGYVVLQCSTELDGVARGVHAVLERARAHGLAVLELPLGPIHGDHPSSPNGAGHAVTPASWPHPLLIAELIARAQAVIAQSFHAGAVAIAAGTPLYRPKSPTGWKYEALENVERVHLLNGSSLAREEASDFGSSVPSVAASERAAQLARHWDAVAQAAGTGGEKRPSPWALALIAGLPHVLNETDDAACALASRIDLLTHELASSEAASAARIESLETDFATLLAQKDALSAQLDGHGLELAALRSRNASLEQVRERKVVRFGLAATKPLALLGHRRNRERNGES